MGIAFIPLYIRYLGVESYGLIGLFSVLNACLQVVNMGMAPTLNREMARFTAGAYSPELIKDLLRSLELLGVGLAFCAFGFVWFASDWLAANWLHSESLAISEISDAIAAMGFVIALRFMEGLYQGAIFGLQRQAWYNAAQSALATLRWAGAVGVLAWYSPTIQAYFLWQSTMSLATVIVYSMAIYRWLPDTSRRPKFSVEAVKQVCRFAGGIMATTVLALMLTQVDKALLSKLLSLENFGYYTLATMVSGALYQVVTPITQAYYPRLTELHTAKDDLAVAQAYHHGAQLVTIILGTGALTLAIYGQNILRLWTGDSHLAHMVAPVLSWIAVGTFLNGLMYMPYSLQLAFGWPSLAVRINCVAVVILVPAIFLVVPRYGAIGAAWIWVALNAGYVTIAIQLMHRRILPSEKWRWYCQDVAIPFCAATSWILLSALAMPPGMGFSTEIAWILVSALGGCAAATMTIKPLRRTVLGVINVASSSRPR